MSATLDILRLLAGAHEPEALWEQLEPLLARLSLEEVEELDRRIVLGPDDIRPGAPPTARRRLVNGLLQRKFEAFRYECFDPFVNPWQLEARMRELFWRMEFVRDLADRLEEVAEANKNDPNLPWTVSSNLFGMANSALLAWHLGGWDDTVPGYGQGDSPPVLHFSPVAAVPRGEPRAPGGSQAHRPPGAPMPGGSQAPRVGPDGVMRSAAEAPREGSDSVDVVDR